MASQLILDEEIRTGLGVGRLLVVDTSPTAQTPDLRKRDVAPIKLEWGDQTRTEDGFLLSAGSFFDLNVEDPQRQLQRLFREAFDDRRFEVTLEVPLGGGQKGIWDGYVKSSLQTRGAAQRTRQGRAQVTCFDGLALLDEDDTAVNARALDVKDFLTVAFGFANPRPDIIFRSDLEAKTIEGNVVGFDKLRPFAGNPGSYEPPQPNGDGGESDEKGLEGGTLLKQLQSLADSLTATAYLDIRQRAWVLMDTPSVGAPVTAERYSGSEWTTYQVPEQSVQVSAAEIEDKDNAYKTQRSVRAVCTQVENWLRDPFFEASTNGTDLFFWDQSGDQRNSDGYLVENTNTGDFTTQRVDFTDISLYDDVDVIGLDFKIADQDPSSFQYELGIDIEYGNGDVTRRTEFVDETTTSSFFLFPKDPSGGHDSIAAITFLVDMTDVKFDALGLGFLRKLTPNPLGNNIDNNKFAAVTTFCYTAAEGRTEVKPDAGSFLTVLSGGDEAPAAEWQSKRYDSSPYDRLSRWRATNLLALRPPGYERLKTTLEGVLAPFGTRLKVQKPGDRQKTVFVPHQSRTLHLGTKDHAAATDVQDVELPDAVLDLLTTHS